MGVSEARRLGLCALVAASAAVAMVLGAPNARSASSGTWSEVQGPNLPVSSSRVSVLRAPDGALLVAYSDSGDGIEVSRVGTDGTWQSTVDAVPGAAGNVTDNPALVPAADGKPLLLFNGFRAGQGAGNGVYSSSGDATGASWSSPALAGPEMPGSNLVGATAADGTVFYDAAAFDLTSSVALHRGLDPALANQTIQGSASAQDPGLAIDGSSGAVWAGWISGSPQGLDVQQVDSSSGAPTGAVLQAPSLTGSPVVLADPGNSTLAFAARAGHAGVYAAYVDKDDQSKVLLWRVGDPTPTAVSDSRGDVGVPTLAPAPGGGLWIIWTDDTAGVQTIQARELLADGTTLGPISQLAVPTTGSFLDVEELAGSGASGRVDIVLGGFSNGQLRFYDAQVAEPSLTTGGTISGKVTATDGNPVAGALIQACPVRGKTCLTTTSASDGSYSFVGLSPGSYQLTAFAPHGRILDTTVFSGLSSVAAGATLAGQDFVMNGPLTLPGGTSVGFPTVDGVPVIRRNQPLVVSFDVPNDAYDPQIVIVGGTDDPDVMTQIAGSFKPGSDCSGTVRWLASDVYVCEVDADPLPPGDDAPPPTPDFLGPATAAPSCPIGTVSDGGDACIPVDVPPLPGTDTDVGNLKPCPPGTVGAFEPACFQPHPQPPPMCPEGTLGTPPNCVDFQTYAKNSFKTHRVGKIIKVSTVGQWLGVHVYTICESWEEPLVEGPDNVPAIGEEPFFGQSAGYFSVSVHHEDCSTMWVDPSGYVRSTKGVGVPGAKVVLQRSTAAKGPFSAVAKGSPVMSPVNRRNPDRTDSSGHFGWDVISGFYRVRATKPGCSAPRRRRQHTVSTGVLRVPPPAYDVLIKLRCPPAPAASAKPKITGRAAAGRTVHCTRGTWRGSPRRFAYTWIAGGFAVPRAHKPALALPKADRGQRLSCMVTATGRYGAGAARSKSLRIHG
jgi:Carboxypeptidase regulatory-like domain